MEIGKCNSSSVFINWHSVLYYCIENVVNKKVISVISSSSSYLFAQNSTRHLKQSQADNELDGQGSNGALTAT